MRGLRIKPPYQDTDHGSLLDGSAKPALPPSPFQPVSPPGVGAATSDSHGGDHTWPLIWVILVPFMERQELAGRAGTKADKGSGLGQGEFHHMLRDRIK